MRGKGGGCNPTHFEGELHCVAAEPQQTVLRVAVVDEADAEVAYETCVLGVLREGYRVLHLRSMRGTRIKNCFLLCHVSFTTQVNAWVGEQPMVTTLRQLQGEVDSARSRIRELEALAARVHQEREPIS